MGDSLVIPEADARRDGDRPGTLGIGIDLVDHDRVRRALERWGDRFRQKVFLPSERTYCDGRAAPWRHYAGRFAVQEAVSKAFGTGIGEHLGWQDIEVIRDPNSGVPAVRLSSVAEHMARCRGVGDVLVSLSHSRTSTVAQVLLVAQADSSEGSTTAS